MPDEEPRLQSTFDLKTVILLVTMFAGIGGTWAVMGERIATSQAGLEGSRSAITLIYNRISELEKEAARTEVRFENLQDDIARIDRRNP